MILPPTHVYITSVFLILKLNDFDLGKRGVGYASQYCCDWTPETKCVNSCRRLDLPYLW